VCWVTYHGAGSHSIRARYTGDANYAGSQSAPLAQTVRRPRRRLHR
jgi:hypothetical protein